MIKARLKKCYFLLSNNLFDPLEWAYKLKALPFFMLNALKYVNLNSNKLFRIRFGDIWYRSHDRFSAAGTAAGHYFYQDLWAADYLNKRGIQNHVDVGSRVDGFIAHILQFCTVTYVDIRPLSFHWEGFVFKQGTITDLPFENDVVTSLSCLHVIEHIGLGRYGDTVAPEAYIDAAKELTRVLAPGGILLLGTPVGRERLCFDAHRIFDPQSITDAFSELQLVGFSLIDDKGQEIIRDASFDRARQCSYGCGLFIFAKNQTHSKLIGGIV